MAEQKLRKTTKKSVSEIYFAGGCFWGTEHFFKLVGGVVATEVGYANSLKENPTYNEVCTGETNAAETVRVIYDVTLISLSKLIELYFETIDPTSLNKQGEDVGTQYRTGIYFTKKKEFSSIKKVVKELSKKYEKPVVVEILPLENFYSAETYHQDYLDKNPKGYCHIPAQLFEMARRTNPTQ